MAIRDKIGYTKKTVDIGNWDMDTDASTTVAHGLSATEWKTIRNIQAIVRNDADTEYHMLGHELNDAATGLLAGAVGLWNSSTVSLARYTTGFYDAATYSTPPSSNRGWVIFEYIAD